MPTPAEEITNTYLYNIRGRIIYERQTWLPHPPGLGKTIVQLEQLYPATGAAASDSFDNAVEGMPACHWNCTDLQDTPYLSSWFPWFAREQDEKPLMIASTCTRVTKEMLNFLDDHSIPF